MLKVEPMRLQRSSILVLLAAMGLLATMGFLMWRCAVLEAQTNDEAIHLTVGYSYWCTGDFRLDPEHPPLMRLLYALPLLPLHLEWPVDEQAWRDRDFWTLSNRFLYDNRVDAEVMLLRGRAVAIGFTVLFGLAVFLVMWKLFGQWAALLFVMLYCLDPNIMAHGHLITTDMGGAAFSLLALLSLGWYVLGPSSGRLVIAGVFAGLALAAKFNSVFVLLVGACVLTWQVVRNRLEFRRGLWTWIKLNVLYGITAVGVLLLSYWPELWETIGANEYRVVWENFLDKTFSSPGLRSNLIEPLLFHLPVALGRVLHSFFWVLRHVKSGNEYSYLFGEVGRGGGTTSL